MRENKEERERKQKKKWKRGTERNKLEERKEKREKEDEIKYNLLGLTMNFPQNNVCPLSRIFCLFYYGTVLGLSSMNLSFHAAWL
jgi:hypothetical protein